MSGIALEHVSKVFPDGTAAVDDVDLRIHDGEFFVLLGPSGCGKSTLLRLVAGLEDLTSGTVRIGDRVVNRVPAGERDLAMVFEGAALYPHLDVADNIGFPLRVAGEPAERRSGRVGGVAGRLRLGGLLGRRPSALSEGERRRTAVGRAMVRRPRAFLMDEPLSNLDARLRGEMRMALGRLHRELGTTILYVTHDQAEAMALSDRVAVMRSGRVERVDEPQALYEHPETLFVAAFLGSPPMNLWHVRLAEEKGRGLVLECGRRSLPVPASRRAELRGRVGGALVLGLRPESLTPASPREVGSVLDLPVALVEALGSHLLVHLEADGAGLQLADDPAHTDAVTFTRPTETLVARLPPDTRARAGDRLRVRVDLERAHFFDPATQRALG